MRNIFVKKRSRQIEIKRQELCNKFYLELRNWYFWATEESRNPDYSLRLIIRLLICFFLQDKGLVPKELFDENFINENLKSGDEYRYYNAILRNLFFNCLNAPIKNRTEPEHKKLIKNIRNIKDQFQKIPFLNGGLFYKIEDDDFLLHDEYFFCEPTTKHILELDGNYKVAGIIKILSQYKYKLSVDDLIDSEYTQTVDPEFIGKVFESLLVCIDADSKKNRRKITGSFYTPREIVNYMVNETLDSYLQNYSQKISQKISQKNSQNNLQNNLQKDSQNNSALLQCKILDPVCGSGAFPCGVMNEIIRRLDPDKKFTQQERYQKKLKILQNVIYGVDIQPVAIQIAILRLFLSLIQEIVPDKQKDNFGIEPLPNLETKFICADTLISLNNENKNEKQKQGLLSTFGIDDGFDIVIGNPPYNVLDNKIPQKTEYEKIYANLKSGRMNIYQCFFGKGTELLNDNGTLAFIHPKTLLGDAYFAATRKFLLKEYPAFTIVNIANRKNTFSSVIQSVVISQWNKDAKTTNCRIGEVVQKDDLHNISYLIKPKSELITKHGTLLASRHIETYKIDKKINNVKCMPLNFVTGNAEWNKIKKHLSAKPSTNAKQFIYGENIQRYNLTPPNKRAKTAFINGAANVKTLQKLAILTQRTTATEQPYRIIATLIDPNDFDYPVVVENHTNVFVCENSTNVFVCENKDTALYILGILNSRLMDFYFRQHNSNTHVSSRELNRLPIINIPPKEQQPLIKLVKRRLTGINIDDQIDKLVYDLYALTKNERKFIETFFDRNRSREFGY
ncbi:MAG: Eco57I restriction-modification methylase domain-containing protein [Planctomycetaceae bacterium]|jgi:hypothetical protein|nr:Eco57I restriction-modification methylase domain-containing protein [Planctomycetaceae bacterium]